MILIGLEYGIWLDVSEHVVFQILRFGYMMT